MNVRHAAELRPEPISLASHRAQSGEAQLATQRRQLEVDLRGALERSEFLLHYQPKVSCNGGRILASRP